MRNGRTIKGLLAGACSLALFAGLSTQAHAALVGNPLISRDQGSDILSFVYSIQLGSPIISSGTVNSVSIYEQNTPGDTFHVVLLRPTGTGQTYNQYFVSPAFVDTAATGITAFSFGSTVNVQPGDVFATYGKGIPFDGTPTSVVTSSDQVYYENSTDFYPLTVGNVNLASYPLYDGQRIYSVALNFTATPEPASLGVMLAGSIGLLIRKRKMR